MLALDREEAMASAASPPRPFNPIPSTAARKIPEAFLLGGEETRVRPPHQQREQQLG